MLAKKHMDQSVQLYQRHEEVEQLTERVRLGTGSRVFLPQSDISAFQLKVTVTFVPRIPAGPRNDTAR